MHFKVQFPKAISLIELVRQKHKAGCVPACLSMITGIPYDDIVTELGIDPEIGTEMGQWKKFLQNHGYGGFIRTKTNSEKWFPDLWSNVHLGSYRHKPESRVYHMVLVLKDGKILDPQGESEFEYSTLPNLNYIASVHLK